MSPISNQEFHDIKLERLKQRLPSELHTRIDSFDADGSCKTERISAGGASWLLTHTIEGETHILKGSVGEELYNATGFRVDKKDGLICYGSSNGTVGRDGKLIIPHQARTDVKSTDKSAGSDAKSTE